MTEQAVVIRSGVVVSVGFDPTVIADQVAADPALNRSIHQDLLDALSVHGRLVFSSREDLDAFVALIPTLSSSVAKLWETLLASRRVSLEVLDPPVEPGIAQAMEPEELAQRFASRVDLVLLERDHAELLGVPPDEFSSRAPGGTPELGRLSTATQTESIRRAKELLDAPIRAGDSREDVWDQRIGPLVGATKSLVIYDRYAGIQAARRWVFKLKARDGLSWLVGKVALTPGHHVRLITAVTDQDGGKPMHERIVAEGLQIMRDQLAERDVKLDVVLVPDGRGRFGHDRHVRFGERVALSMGPGLQVFARGAAEETVVVARLPVSDAKEREAAAERLQIRPPADGWVDNRRLARG